MKRKMPKSIATTTKHLPAARKFLRQMDKDQKKAQKHAAGFGFSGKPAPQSMTEEERLAIRRMKEKLSESRSALKNFTLGISLTGICENINNLEAQLSAALKTIVEWQLATSSNYIPPPSAEPAGTHPNAGQTSSESEDPRNLIDNELPGDLGASRSSQARGVVRRPYNELPARVQAAEAAEVILQAINRGAYHDICPNKDYLRAALCERLNGHSIEYTRRSRRESS